MKYAIYGAGSLGIVLGAWLSDKTKTAVTVIDRNKKSVDALNKNGAKVLYSNSTLLVSKVNAILETEVKEKFDIIFLLTKQIGNVEIVKKASKMLSKNGVICTMQNGLPEEDVASVIGKERTFGCAIGWGATRIEPGISELTSEPSASSLSFSLGSYAGLNNEYLAEMKNLLSLMGEVSVEENFIGARWVKVLINSAFSGMSAVCGDTFGEVAKNKNSRKIIQRIIKECIDVANAAKIKIEPIQGKDVVKLIDYHNNFKKKISFMIIPLAIKKHSKLKASMLQDLEKGIKTEVDSINGVVCAFGKKFNVKTPFNEMVAEIIHKCEEGKLKPSFENTKFFNEILKVKEY